jgi:hypothetical protein
MESASRIGGVGVAVSLVLLAASPTDAAATKRITGKLSKPGYTVIALAASGKARSVRAKGGRFRLRPPAKRISLQLRAPNGSYAGPIVVGRRGGRVIVGVKAGARLGAVTVDARKGFARVKRRLPKRWIDGRRTARARKGIPIGAGRFGRVRSRHVRATVRGDLDLDGIPDVLDVDDDGDKILDRLDRSSARSAVRAAADPEDPEQFGFHTRLTLYLDTTANANAAGLTPAQMDTALASGGDLLLTLLSGDASPNSPELDCGGAIQQPPRPDGLIYCRPHSSGGIGRLFQPAVPDSALQPFPDCCDPDGDGLGSLNNNTGPPVEGAPLGAFTLRHRATTSQIGTGDVMIQRVTRSGVETSFLAALQYVFASVPALVSYDDGQGNAVTVPYPVPAPVFGVGGGPGTRDNGLSVKARPNGDVVLTLTFWRPQRKAVPAWGETGEWIDIGRLKYEVQVEESGRRCPQSAFFEKDPDLALHSSSPIYADYAPGFSDTDGDHPASGTNTFTYTLNLTRCLESNGFSFNPGEQRGFSFLAVNPSGVDNAQQGVWFKRQ